LSKRVIYKIDCPANRYDLLCLEGLVASLKIFQGRMPLPAYSLSPAKPQATMKITVHAAVAQIRPYVVAAVLRGVTFDQDRYQSFIDLQDKMHQNICRKRTLVSIGTHDLSSVTPPFTYEALPPKDIVFKPLSQEETMDGHRMMEVLSTHQQLKAYLPFIRDSPVYPVIYDSKRVVLSVPPIINGDHSKIKLSTKDVFIEVTATDLTKANVTLNTMVAMFVGYCAKPFIIEPVEVEYAKDYPANSFTKGGDKLVYPNIAPRIMDANIPRMKLALGLEKLAGNEVRDLLRKMGLHCELDKKDGDVLKVEVPITRSDIMHECDLVEDLAIGFGYNNLTQTVPSTLHWPAEHDINHLTDLVRNEMATAGFNECYNWGLLSRQENFGNMRRAPAAEAAEPTSKTQHEYDPSSLPVGLSNPKTKEFEIVRTSLLPGLLKTLHSNKHNSPPIKIFEVSDVVIQEPTRETKSKNVRRVAAMIAGSSPQFETLHGLLDQLMYSMNAEAEHEHVEGSKRKTYKLEPSSDPAFFPGQQAHIVVDGVNIGVLGVLHPEVVSGKGFDINLSTSAMEVNIEPFLEWL